MSRFFLVFLILILIFATTYTKNSTKELDKKLYETKENINLLNHKFEYLLLDYNYLTSPQKLMEYQIKYFEKSLLPMKINQTKKIILKENTFVIKDINNKLND